MAKINKISVEKVLRKLRSSDASKPDGMQLTDKMDALADEIERLRAQRLRLERTKRRSTKTD
jgi:hypothetical protein